MKNDSPEHLKIGAMGESIVLKHLQRNGYTFLERNFRAKTGEIDLIVERGDVVHFVEVKTVSREILDRESANVSYETHRPEENVDRRKVMRLHRTIQIWLFLNKYQGKWQIDVAALILDVRRKRARLKIIDNIVGGVA